MQDISGWNKSSAEFNFLLDFLNSRFSGLSIDAILDLGSHAKEETHEFSDHDFRVYAHTNSSLLINPGDINNDIIEVENTKVDLALTQIYKLQPTVISQAFATELAEAWKNNFRNKCDIILVDTHSLFWDLALETAFSALRTQWSLHTCKIVYEDKNIISTLQREVLCNRYYHWFPTIELQISRYKRRKEISNLYNSLILSKDGDYSFLLDRWIRWSLNYIRFAVSSWSFAKYGYYTFKKDEVLNFAATNFHQSHFQYIQQLYAIKTNPVLKKEEIAKLASDKKIMIDEITNQKSIISSTLDYSFESTSKFKPSYEKNCRKENAVRILEIASNWINIPKVSIELLLAKSLNDSKDIINCFLNDT